MNGTIFGIGPLEFLFVVILTLLVFGPERLPELMRGIGNTIRRAREMYVGFTKEFQNELQPIAQDIDNVTREIRQEVEAIREAADIRSILKPYADDLNKAVKLEEIDAAKPFTVDDVIQMNTPTVNSLNGSSNGVAHSNGNGKSKAHRRTISAPMQAGNVTLGDDNPWANIGAPVRSDKLDDDSPWRL